jgi:polygalacturonase
MPNPLTRRGFLQAGALAAGGALLGVHPAAAHEAWAPPAAPDPDEEAELAAILRRIVPPTFPPRVFDVTQFGAVGDGQTDCRAAFARAVHAANAAGGGRVLVPAGRWRMDGPIHLKSNVELHLAEGATVRFSADPQHYLPLVLTRWEGTECFNYSPFVYAYQANNVAITGPGTLDGNGAAEFAGWRQRQDADVNRLRQMGIDGVPVHERVFGPGHWLRPGMVVFFACRNVLFEGFRLIDSPFWSVHTVGCQNVTARGLRITSHNPNNDGIDPESSVDVLVEKCVFDTGDDCIAIKSGRDQDGWRVGQASENIVVRDCDFTSLKAALCLGSEMSGGIRNVYLRDVRVDRTYTGIYFKTNLDRGGSIRHVRIRDVPIGQAEIFINFTTAYQGYRGGQHPPDVGDVRIENVTCERANTGIRIVGVPESPIRDVQLRNVTLASTPAPHEIRHVQGFAARDVRINGEPLALPSTIA